MANPAQSQMRAGGPGGGFLGVLPAESALPGEGENLAMLRMGFTHDTPPLKGCCTVTFGYRARTC